MHSSRKRLKAGLAALLAGAAIPAYGSTVVTGGSADSEAAQPVPDEQRPGDIIVTGQALFRDIVPERELDEQAISSYGVSTVDELLGEVHGELGDGDDPPLILVNGERVNSLDEIGAFPVESLSNVRVLPRGSAVRLGGTTGQRVISLSLKKRTRTATLTVAPKFATEGDWTALRGEAILTRIRGSTRANLALRLAGEGSLLESERGILQPDVRPPFAVAGNVVGYPNTSGEIDPLLSSLAGQTVTVVRVPGKANPVLADFAAAPNVANATDLGEFRTLRGTVRNYDLNGTFATRLAPWLTSNATIRLNRYSNRSLRGLPSALFILSPGNPASPFSTNVGLAFYGSEPLVSRSTRNSGDGRLTLNGRFGRWTGNLDARHSVSRNVTDTDRRSTFGNIALDDGTNPFSADISSLIPIRTDRATSRNRTDSAQLSFTGPALALPAGALQATVEGRASWNRLNSSSSFSTGPDRRFSRNEQSIRLAADIPLASRDGEVLSAIGDLDATAELAAAHLSDAGNLHRYAFGMNWTPAPALRLRGAFEESERAPAIQILGSPTVATSDVRMFDPLTGDTVDVVQITGGNPSLKPEKVRITRFGGTLRLVERLNLQLDSEYTDTDARNYISSLPPASAAVMLAFPDRYVRDSSGMLTIADLRPVNFDTHREKRLRWGLSMRTRLAGSSHSPAPQMATDTGSSDDGSAAPETPQAEPQPGPRRAAAARPSTYLQLSANHSVVFSDRIVIRPGLDSVDLLGGGALGIGGGRLRHQIDASAAVTSRGTGVRAGVMWRGKSSLDTTIGGVTDTLHFSPLLTVNMRAFVDASRFLPGSAWAKNTRLSLNVVNATNDRQKVRDSLGNTPLQYQPAYRDPLGRTIEFEIRKVF